MHARAVTKDPTTEIAAIGLIERSRNSPVDTVNGTLDKCRQALAVDAGSTAAVWFQIVETCEQRRGLRVERFAEPLFCSERDQAPRRERQPSSFRSREVAVQPHRDEQIQQIKNAAERTREHLGALKCVL